MSIVSIVEPSSIARERITHNLVSVEDGGFLKQIHSSLWDLDKSRFDSRFDGIILLHSSYYIDDFETAIAKLVNEHLEDDGVMLVLALSRDSRFFLGLPSLCKNTAEDVRGLARKYDWRIDSRNIPSKFKLPKSLNLNEKSLYNLFKFINGHCVGLTLENFKKRLNKYLRTDGNNGIDLHDQLIEIRR